MWKLPCPLAGGAGKPRRCTMARLVEHILTPSATKRVLVVAEDPWLRFRLHRELERAACDVVSVGRLRPADLSQSGSYDVVVTDAAVFPEGSRLEAFRALRAGSPGARFVLLVGAKEKSVAAQARESGFDLVLARPARAEALPELVREVLAEPPAPAEAVPVPMRFQFVLDLPGEGKRKAGTTFTALVIHALLLGAVLLVPLMFTETLNLRELAGVWLVAPPPPPPPPTGAQAPRRVKPVFQTVTGKLIAPTAIPKEIARIVETDELDIQGVPGGVPGGQLGGVLGGVIGGVPQATARPVLAPPVQKPIRVGGKLRPPRLLQRVEPVYPTIAKQARISGDVRIDAIIDTEGNVVDMQVLSGHPLLVQAALGAVSQWRYEPTYLNEQPVPVVLVVTVTFRLQ